MKTKDLHVSNVPHVVAACAVLHNICEISGDHCLTDWIVGDDAAIPSNSTAINPQNATQASLIHDAINDYLYLPSCALNISGISIEILCAHVHGLI